MTFSLIAAANNNRILQSSLLASPDIGGIEVSIQRGASSAASAYNRGIDETRGDVMIFAHQDMYLPEGWLSRLGQAVQELAERNTDWGVLGMFGVTSTGEGAGYLYSTGLQRVVGGRFDGIKEVQTLDEIVLVTRRAGPLRFDEDLPGFHLYGADICAQALAAGKHNFAFSAFGIHNTNGITLLPRAYWKSYMYMRRKWWKFLPLMTPCMPVTRSLRPFVRYFLRSAPPHWLGMRTAGKRVEDPAQLLKASGRLSSL